MSEIDIQVTAHNLISRHERRTQHLSTVLRGTAQAHYRMGVEECLRMIQEAAVLTSGEAPIRGSAAAGISAPLAVQPSHSALETSEP